LACNADESEPGTFNNHEMIDKNPHQLIEGMAIAAYAIGGCDTAYIYIRGEFAYGARVLERAINSAYAKGFLGKNIFGSDFNIDITVHRGAGAYICGEETALIESIEGKIGQPRAKPPYFPAAIGLYMKPTIVNNVETLINAPEYGGGIRGDRKPKIIVPGGASAPWLTAEQLDVTLDYEAVAAAGSMLGTAGIIVLDENTSAVETAYKMDEFFKHESCGKCTPCREGTVWLTSVLHRMASGHGRP